jgi:hypothetical protein
MAEALLKRFPLCDVTHLRSINARKITIPIALIPHKIIRTIPDRIKYPKLRSASIIIGAIHDNGSARNCVAV